MRHASPIILVTAGRYNPAVTSPEQQFVLVGCDIDYLQAVVQAGGTPLLLPCMAPATAVEAALAVAHGVLLTGGGDVSSLCYSEEPHPLGRGQDAGRDTVELAVVRGALARQLPLLGICRGLQVLNVALGGTLYQDIRDEVPGALQHWSQALTPHLLHTIEIAPDSHLARITGATGMAVNSWHHQAVKDVGEGLRITARARDGIIEGLESTTDAPLLAVQYHPEECAPLYPGFQELFDWLVVEAGRDSLRV